MIERTQDSARDLLKIMNRFRLLNKRKKAFGDIPQAEFFMLGTIWEEIIKKQEKDSKATGIMVSELSAKLGTTMSATSKMLRGIEQKGYIERVSCSKDRRAVYLKLTSKGEDVLKEAKQHMEQIMLHIVDKMGEEDIKNLTNLFEKLYYIMKEEVEG